MKRFIFLLLMAAAFIATSCTTRYVVSGPQGGIATTITLPEGMDTTSEQCRMVVLMHGIFSSKSYTPMPRIARQLAKAGVGSIALDFGGHGRSEGKKINMTIEKELAEARAVVDYISSRPYTADVALLGHSQGGVIASMLAGRLASEGRAPSALVLLAPGAVIKDACQAGHFFSNDFDPSDPPHHITCFGFYKVGRDYLTSSQQLDIYGTSATYEGPVCIIHGTNDNIVPLWCSERYDSLYVDSRLHLIPGEAHTMHKHLQQTSEIITSFLKADAYSEANP